MITDKLVEEALGCPVAMIELVRQYNETLDDTERVAFIGSLTFDMVEALAITLMSMTEGVYIIFMMQAGYDSDAGKRFMSALYRKKQQGPYREESMPDTLEEVEALLKASGKI